VDVNEPKRSTRRVRDPEGARAALVAAAARLLVERPPTAISGRELAAEAGVNYGLVHHYFGGKDGALAAGLLALREDLLREHGGGPIPFLAEGHPYFKALVRSQVDYPDAIAADKDFPSLTAMVRSVVERLGGDPVDPDGEHGAEAKARAIAATALQITFGVYAAALLDAARVSHRERPAVEAHLAALHESILLRTP
jgi:AcrR family transcriptional regulator